MAITFQEKITLTGGGVFVAPFFIAHLVRVDFETTHFAIWWTLIAGGLLWVAIAFADNIEEVLSPPKKSKYNYTPEIGKIAAELKKQIKHKRAMQPRQTIGRTAAEQTHLRKRNGDRNGY